MADKKETQGGDTSRTRKHYTTEAPEHNKTLHVEVPEEVPRSAA